MIQTFFHRMTGKPRRTTRLVVEALERRDMPSTLSVPVNPTPPAAWPQPPVVLRGTLDPGGTGASFFAGSADHHVSIDLCGGEEIPQ
jgi:hypothetical protein